MSNSIISLNKIIQNSYFSQGMIQLVTKKGCGSPNWKGDGYCDDENNNKECEYDGGDCCGSNVNTNFCTECACKQSSAAGCELPQYEGDGYCDDGNNNKGCNYDGGDCCGAGVLTNYCTECKCEDPNSGNGGGNGGGNSGCGKYNY